MASNGISVPDPSAICLVIFLHGSEAEQDQDHCVPKVSPEGTVPPVIGNLSGEVVASKRILIYAPCSRVPAGLRGAPDEYKVRQRAGELETLLEQLQDAGYLRRNIFLTGHSAGAWIALTTLAENRSSCAGVIAFAPAFAGRQSGQAETNPFWVSERASQVSVLQGASSLPSLIYAFKGDEFESIDALGKIFETIPGVELVKTGSRRAEMYKGATAGPMYHNGAYHAALMRQKARILKFIEARINSTP